MIDIATAHVDSSPRKAHKIYQLLDALLLNALTVANFDGFTSRTSRRRKPGTFAVYLRT